MDVIPHKIVLYYSQWQPVYDKMREDNLVTEFIPKMPSEKDIKEFKEYESVGGSLVIIDDHALSLNKETAKIFTVTARHSSVSIILITQNLFVNNPYFRDISLQATYIILQKNPRDQSAIKHLAHQIMPGNTKFVFYVYKHALQEPYSYLLIDLHQKTHDKIRFRTNIFRHESPTVVYIPNNEKESN